MSGDATASLESCLPAELRGAATTITPIATGLSGAGVYRVDAADRALVLKVTAPTAPLAAWRRTLGLQRLAAGAGLAPPIVHVDESRRAVVSEFVVDRSFAALLGDPRTRVDALELLGRTVRRVHALPLPPDVVERAPRDQLASTWHALEPGFAMPGFVRDAVRRALDAPAPARDRALVLSHNDLNPTNLVHDGERLVVLDWEVAAANDPFYDLAVLSVFLRLDEATSRVLLAAYEGAPVAALPAGFVYHRRLAALLAGTTALSGARDRGHGGDAGPATRADAPTLLGVYQRMRAGTFHLASAEGLWEFGLALVGESDAI